MLKFQILGKPLRLSGEKLYVMSNESKKLGQDPAYPTEVTTNHNGSFSAKQTGNSTYLAPGMSKRFYAACAAMQGMLASHANPNGAHPQHDSYQDIKKAIETCFKYADELLEQEDE